MRRVLRVCVVLALVVGGLFALPSSHRAAATSAGCTASGNTNANCIFVDGTGAHVNYVRAIRTEYGQNVCDLYAQMTAVHNGAYVEPARYAYAPGCSAPHVPTRWVDFNVNRNYPNGTQICVRIAIDGSGSWTSGAPCATIIAPTVPPIIIPVP